METKTQLKPSPMSNFISNFTKKKKKKRELEMKFFLSSLQKKKKKLHFQVFILFPFFILPFPLLVPRFSNIQQTECIMGDSEIEIFTAVEVKSIK